MAIRKGGDRSNDVVMGVDPLADDDEILARTLYSPVGTGAPLSTNDTPTAISPSAPATTPMTKTSAVSTHVATGTAVAAPKSAALPPEASVASPGMARRRIVSAPDVNHYKVLSISLYNEDIERMDELVRELKTRGFTRANRSALIRFALDQVDITKMPKGY